ncbi:hypothetical protein UPYG_G00338710 [Umbra pygmaea]|uniref:Zinc fingers and homeoboxes protein 1 n=1 Tax=Umbra pygmaea TaxID=75934 RepID=A0ABD0W0Y0_UMBPY
MVAPVETADSDPDMEVVTEQDEEAEGEAANCSVEQITETKTNEDDTAAMDHFIKTMDSSMAEGGYECKYCSFQTSQLNMFTLHVDTEHPNIVLNSSYVCVECDFHTKRYDALLEHNTRYHPGEDSFTRTMVKRNNQTLFEQRVNDLTFDGSFVKVEEDEDTSCKGIALSKTPIMKVKSKVEAKKFPGPHQVADLSAIKVESDGEDETSLALPTVTPNVIAMSTPLTVQPVQQSIMVNSPNMLQIKTTNATTMLPPGTLAQVLSALQNQQASQTQLLIPVSSIPTYNAAMDNNVLLVSAYNRFPYPSVSEIMGLAAQTKFTEEQIKVWFSAQRLKHGVSWTPEEVEEARRKKFNGSVQTVPQTITVIPANFATAANGLQSIFQTCQIVGQPGMVLTQVGGGGNAVPVASPITLTVAGVPNPRTNASKAPETSTSETASPLSPDPLGARPKKSKEQLAELKASYLRRQFATEAEISRLMKVTNLTKRAIKKWFSDTRYNQRNSKDHQGVALNDILVSANSNDGSSGTAIVIDSSDEASDSSPTTQGPIYDPRIKFRHAFPDFTPQKFKEKTQEQLLLLEASYQKSEKPSDEELSRLRMETKLTRREVDAWFSERRKSPADSDGTEEPKSERVKAPSSGQEAQTPPSGRKIMKKTPEQLHVLKSAFVRTQWPSAEEYDKMAEETGLPRTYIVNWFGDTRYACKNSNLKWYYLYQSGKVDENMNGGGLKKKPRKRFRGWSRRTRRPYPCKQTPPTVKVKTGKDILKEHYLKNKVLNEKDLDELVAKSSMSYEQVRDWFAEISRREENGLDLFSDVEKEMHVDSEGEMDAKEQGTDVANEEIENDDDDDDNPITYRSRETVTDGQEKENQ